ncbi:hypothetical protein GQX73_g6066 [Xylaria multiplex]|uniref:Uncharacterized protein n=1 Tax=Xylaria multiplex TaxID=323545 RepID=A0A7C8ITB2_9PEZI|nr:hypothetical protein GQX73_g6066 [Xylaria multiplex]
MLQLQRARRKYIYPLRRSLSTLNQPTEAGDTTASKDSSDNTEIFYWHPSYLDWPVLAAFSITFLVLAISCQVLLYYSNRSYGLATSYQGLHYLWTYGPTAILTLIASFWARVEYQTKISAPWCRILKGTATSQQSVLLDYVSQFQPFAIYSAVKNKDYPVAASTLASLLLRLTIVISTSLIVLSPLDIRIEDVEVTLKSQFVDNPSGLSTGSHLAYTSLTALVSKDVPLPEGISAKYAYVQAETSIQNISGLITTVDGFEAGLHCDPATVSLSVDTEQESPERDSRGASLDLKSDSCEVSLDVECPDVSGHNSADNFQEPCNSLALSVERCKGSNNTHEMVIGIAASTFMYTPGSPLNSGKSERNDGIADIPVERSKYQLWTVFPGLLSALINIYTASVDADTRSQGPLLRLRHGAAFEALCLDLVDRHTSTLVLEEVRSRGFESLASTLAVVVTSLLAIFSASLFFATTMLGETQVQLKPSSLIYYPTNIEDHDSKLDLLSHTVGEMILLENASYPAFTYQDLTFPSLVLDGTPPSHFAQSGVVYNVTVPAVRPDFTNCRLYDSSQIDIIRGNSPFTFETFFEAIIHPESGCGTDKFYLPTGIDITTMTRDHVYFGNSSFETTKSCSTHVWIWGSWANVSSDDAKAGFRSIYALGCNDTIQTVETSVEFIAQTMAVNPYNPPMPNYLDAVSLTPTNPSPLFHIYIDLPPIARPESDAGLDSFFTIITSSRYAIPVSYLGDTSKVSAVVESIQFHHRILAVQILDQQWRFQNRNLSDSLNLDIPTVLNATARDPSGRNRVVQDVVATRVLQSLLSATLVCLGVNWFLMRNVDVVPRSPTSIANWMALLADGNLDDFLPRDAGQMPLDKISRWCFGLDAVFYLGFRKSPVSGKDVLGIYVVSRHSTLDEPVESGI